MREKESGVRESLERTMRLTRELIDRMHYDSLSKECVERFEALKEEFIELVEQRVDILGLCLTANDDLQRECETLQDQLDAREGRLPRPDPMEVLEPLMGHLPKEQVAALRFVSAYNRMPAPPAPERSDAFDKAKAYLDSLEAKLLGFRREMDTMLDIADERVKRGLTSTEAIEPHRAAAEPHLLQIEKVLEPLRSCFRSSLTGHEALQQRRQELRRALAGHSEDAP
jgi:hypothetical protein